jgi:hypothetical protein
MTCPRGGKNLDQSWRNIVFSCVWQSIGECEKSTAGFKLERVIGEETRSWVIFVKAKSAEV